MSENDLVRKYQPLAYRIAAYYYTNNGDRDDVRQEALVGLLSGIRSWDPAKSSGTLEQFLGLAVRRRLIYTVVRKPNQEAQLLLTRAVRTIINDDGEAEDAVTFAPAANTDPVETIDRRDEVRRVVRLVPSLTPREREALVGVCFEGRSYAEIEGADNAAAVRRVDNALYTARKKLRGQPVRRAA